MPSHQGVQKKVDYTRFKHSTHTGIVKSLTISGKKANLDCAYCHGNANQNKLDIENIAYPSHKFGQAAEKTHSSCTECHAITGPAAPRDMCTICHTDVEIDSKKMATNIKRFPNPSGPMQSQFFDNFSHSSHVKYYDNKFDCKACHTVNTGPVLAGRAEYKNTGIRMSRPGHTECFTCHLDAKVVSPPSKEKPDPKNTFATNCIGCHKDTSAPFKNGRPATGSELALNWFGRKIVDTENNYLNAIIKPTKNNKPFSHSSHDDSVIGKKEKRAVGIDEKQLDRTESCLVCHATGKTANTISDFYLEDKKYKEKQPLAYSCVDCHKKDGMQQKIEGAITIENSKCNYCHSINTIKAMAFLGSEWPPRNHYYNYKDVLASKAPTPPPPAVSESVSEKPAPAAIAQTNEVATDKQTEKPAPVPAITDVASTSINNKEERAASEQPVPQPAPTPINPDAGKTPAASDAPPSTGSTTPMRTEYNGFRIVSPTGGKPQTIPTIPRLGDTKDNPYWGKSDKWGVVENFNHETHIQPKYSKSCQDCHHTNTDSREELKVGLVPLCTSCHYDDSNPKNPKNKAGDEIDVELAYHGNPDNQTNNAGCIECHRRYYDTNPDAERIAPTGKCAGCHTEKMAWYDNKKYFNIWSATTSRSFNQRRLVAAYMIQQTTRRLKLKR